MADAIRVLAMDAVEQAQSGHPGMPMGMADAATVLWTRFLKFDPARPHWPDRDRFVLSAGHGSMLLYALLHLTGYPGMTLEELKRFRQLGSRSAGHPEHGHAPGIETTTGPLGQGLANAVGMALAERLLAARFGDALVDHYTYVIAGDGCLMEGISQEAISLAGHLRPRQADRAVGRQSHLDRRRHRALDLRRPAAALRRRRLGQRRGGRPRPDAVAAALIAGARDRASLAHRLPHHHRLRRADQGGIGRRAWLAAGRRRDRRRAPAPRLGASRLSSCPSDVADLVAGGRARAARPKPRSWQQRLEAAPMPRRRAEFERAHARARWRARLRRRHRRRYAPNSPPRRRSSRRGKPRALVLDALAPVLPELIGGSADLTGSNNTKAKSQKVITAGDFSGSYIHYGIREHGMAAAMNGMAVAWRHHPLWRHLPGLHRLLPAGDPARGADGTARRSMS